MQQITHKKAEIILITTVVVATLAYGLAVRVVFPTAAMAPTAADASQVTTLTQ